MTDTTETVNMEDWKSEKEHDAFLDRCIEETATGNMEGFKKLYTETKSSVYSFALSMLKKIFFSKKGKDDYEEMGL